MNEIKMKLAKQLWMDGRTVQDIADLCGVTKGVISGITFRNRDLFPVRVKPPRAKTHKVKLDEIQISWTIRAFKALRVSCDPVLDSDYIQSCDKAIKYFEGFIE